MCNSQRRGFPACLLIDDFPESARGRVLPTGEDLFLLNCFPLRWGGGVCRKIDSFPLEAARESFFGPAFQRPLSCVLSGGLFPRAHSKISPHAARVGLFPPCCVTAPAGASTSRCNRPRRLLASGKNLVIHQVFGAADVPEGAQPRQGSCDFLPCRAEKSLPFRHTLEILNRLWHDKNNII